MPGADSQAVVEFYETVNAWIANYFADPGQELGRTPGVEQVFERLTDDAEWAWLFTPGTLVGREQMVSAAADFASTVSDWHLVAEEVTELGGGRVLVKARVQAHGTGSGTPIAEAVWSLFIVRDGKVARIEDHSDPDAARRSAGA